MKVNSKNKMKLWKRSQIQVFFIKRNVLCLLLLVTIPKRDRVHGWQSLQPDHWLVPSFLLLFVSGSERSWETITASGAKGMMGRWKGEKKRLSSSHLPIIPRASLERASLVNRDLKMRQRRRRRQRERQKSNRFSKQNNNFARVSHLFVHFFVITARLQRGNNFSFYGGGKQATKKFTFSFWTWIRLLGEFLHIWKNKWYGIIAMKIEETPCKRETSARRMTEQANAIKMHLSPKARGWIFSVA